MAIYSGRILMRKGLEADFDAEKLMSGEWALSTDKGIVRICLEAGKVIRMATYEAFEEDMKQIEAILLECQTIEEAVQRINTEINAKVDAVVEYVGQAKTYRDEAKTFRDEAEAFKNQAGEIAGIDIATTEKAGIVKPDGETLEVDADGTMRVIGGGGVSDYSELDNKPSINGAELDGEMSLKDLGIASATELEKTNTKVDTIIEKADLGIKETASGEELHLIDSAEGKAVEFALYGKAKQNTTSGKNLLENTATSQTLNGVTFTVNNDGSVTANGTATATIDYPINQTTVFENGTYILSGCPVDGSATTYRLRCTRGFDSSASEFGNGATLTKTSGASPLYLKIDISSGTVLNNLVFKPMIRLASITDSTYEPYTNGASPNPSYPQEIEVSGESYNLLENKATSQEIKSVNFTVNEDKSVEVVGTASGDIAYIINSIPLSVGKYILSGIPSGLSNITLRVGKGASSTFVGNDLGSGFTFEVTSEDTYTFQINVSSGATISNVIVKPMIRKASVKNDRYMPYGKGSVEVKSVGKNLIPYPYQEGTKTANGITFTVNENDGSINVNGTASANTFFNLVDYTNGNLLLKNGIYTLSINSTNVPIWVRSEINTGIATTKGSVNFTIEKEESLGVFLRIPSGTKVDNETVYPMIRYAEITDDTYQPYKETLSTIPTPNGLAGIKVSSNGNYTDSNGQQWICDEVVKYADGSGAYIQRIGKSVFDGSEDEAWSTNVVGTINRFYIKVSDSKVDSARNLVVCSHGIFTLDHFSGASFISAQHFYLYNELCTSVEEFKTWLSENNVTVYYELAEPITTPLTAEELAEIETFYPVTNISNDFDCGMRIEYVGDSIITTNTEIPLVEPKDEEELESGDNIVTLFGKIKRKLKSVGKGVVDVVDNLLSTSTTLPLSANQGRVLDEKISTINESLEGFKSNIQVGTFSETIKAGNSYTKTITLTNPIESARYIPIIQQSTTAYAYASIYTGIKSISANSFTINISNDRTGDDKVVNFTWIVIPY